MLVARKALGASVTRCKPRKFAKVTRLRQLVQRRHVWWQSIKGAGNTRGQDQCRAAAWVCAVSPPSPPRYRGSTAMPDTLNLSLQLD
jgi:hypothetical protein